MNSHAAEPRDASEEEVNEEAAVTESMDSPENYAVIQNLKADDGEGWLTCAAR